MPHFFRSRRPRPPGHADAPSAAFPPPEPPPQHPHDARPNDARPNDDRPPMMRLPGRQKAVIMGALMITLFLSALDQTVMSVAMPRIIADLGGLDLFAWPFTSYMLTSTVTVPIVGKISDLRGRKPILVTGILVFLAGSVLAGAAQDMTSLIVYRAIQGLGGGLINAMAFTMVGDIFSPRERGRWLGVFASTWALASIVGPLAGGAIADNLSWRWVFYINVPLALIALPVALRFIPHHVQAQSASIDWRGGLLLVVAATPLLLALSWAGNEYGWGEAPVVVSFAIAAVALALFIWTESRAAEPVLPLGLFRTRAYAVTILITAVTSVAMMGSAQFIPLFLQGAQGASATASGIVTMPMMGGVVVSAAVAGQIVHRTGSTRPLAVGGAGIMAVCLYLLTTLDVGSSQNLTGLYMLLLGIGVGAAMPMHSMIVQNALPHRLLGVGTSSVQFFRQIGATMGIAVFGSVLIAGFAGGLATADIAGAELLAERPQILLDPTEVERFRAEVDAGSPGTSEAALESAREALATAVTDIFRIATVIAVLGAIAALALPGIAMKGDREMRGGRPPRGPLTRTPAED